MPPVRWSPPGPGWSAPGPRGCRRSAGRSRRGRTTSTSGGCSPGGGARRRAAGRHSRSPSPPTGTWAPGCARRRPARRRRSTRLLEPARPGLAAAAGRARLAWLVGPAGPRGHLRRSRRRGGRLPRRQRGGRRSVRAARRHRGSGRRLLRRHLRVRGHRRRRLSGPGGAPHAGRGGVRATGAGAGDARRPAPGGCWAHPRRHAGVRSCCWGRWGWPAPSPTAWWSATSPARCGRWRRPPCAYPRPPVVGARSPWPSSGCGPGWPRPLLGCLRRGPAPLALRAPARPAPAGPRPVTVHPCPDRPGGAVPVGALLGGLLAVAVALARWASPWFRRRDLAPS